MGVRNVLVEGVSGSGKTAVCHELRRRGFAAINGDTDLAYQGDPDTGEPLPGFAHEHHVWPVEEVRRLAAGQQDAVLFFCGGSRNHGRFLDVFDVVLVLEVDRATLDRRLRTRPEDEFGGRDEERALVHRLHRTRQDLPDGLPVDATAPLGELMDEVLRLGGVSPSAPPARGAARTAGPTSPSAGQWCPPCPPE